MSTEAKFDKEQFVKFIQVLKEAKCLDNVLVIGSWAEYLYEETGYLNNFHAPMGTKDLDLLVRNIRAPEKETSIAEIAKKYGFESRVDYISQVNMYAGSGGFEVEFLIGSKWKDLDESKWQPMTDIGVRATAKADMWPMLDYCTSIRYENFRLYIPEPEAYFIHKILINNTREEKQYTDIQKIKHIFPYLDNDRLSDIYDRCYKSERSRIDTFFKNHFQYPSLQYYLEKDKQVELTQDKQQVILQGIREIYQCIEDYNKAKTDYENGSGSKTDVDKAKRMKNATLGIVQNRIFSAGISYDDLWAVLAANGMASKDNKQITDMFKQKDIHDKKNRGKEDNGNEDR